MADESEQLFDIELPVASTTRASKSNRELSSGNERLATWKKRHSMMQTRHSNGGVVVALNAGTHDLLQGVSDTNLNFNQSANKRHMMDAPTTVTVLEKRAFILKSLFTANTLGSKKNYGIRSHPEAERLDDINKEVMEDPDMKEVEDLAMKLNSFKEKFLEFDKDADGNIDEMGLKRMMEKLGQAKTHLEMKKMIKEIDRTDTGTICYRDFVAMMLDAKTSVLKLILLFEEKMKDKERPTGVAPKRDLASLP